MKRIFTAEMQKRGGKFNRDGQDRQDGKILFAISNFKFKISDFLTSFKNYCWQILIINKSLFIPFIPVKHFFSLRLRVSAVNFPIKLILLFSFYLLPFTFVNAQSGVLIPSSKSNKPDPKTLSLQVMNVDILIDNGHASVKVLQIFDNHTSETLEGKYVFALPLKSSIFDFAVWDGDTRIPGVMIEKRRANEVYTQIKQAQIDPGILQQTDETESGSAFSAKVFPINSFGSKRLELEYTENLEIENLTSHFSFPLKSSYGETQTVGEFNLRIRVISDLPIFTSTYYDYPLQITKLDANSFEGEFHAKNIELKNDFSFDYQINSIESLLSFIAYRSPEKISAYDLRDPKLADKNADGYFQAKAVFNQNSSEEKTLLPRRVVLLLDTSLSMYGNKLQSAFEATEYFLTGLKPQDEFNLILFNTDAEVFNEKPVSATTENVENALRFVKNSSLVGGTNLKNALQKAVAQARNFPESERNIILVSDANPTLETTDFASIKSVFDNDNSAKLFAFALGNDANSTLLKDLSEMTNGYFSQASETEDIAILLKNFLNKIGTSSIENLRFDSENSANFYDVYATNEKTFNGSGFSYVGRYKNPLEQTNISILGNFGAENLLLSRQVSLPVFDDKHTHLPRVWARARVDALLREMNRNGEREDYISEIIRLSQKYKFVTPYTAFLAAPRSLLRPRVIQPGDPVIRVKTDESITEVFAVLPFGETLPLKFLEAEGVWETRFLAPVWMKDGTYKCRLLLTDKDGNGYQEEKTFVVDSKAPTIKIEPPMQNLRAGDEMLLKVSSDSDTMRLVARIYGAKPVQLSWSDEAKTNIGRLKIPENLSSGKYVLTVTAEDFAHNQTSEEFAIEILGK